MRPTARARSPQELRAFSFTLQQLLSRTADRLIGSLGIVAGDVVPTSFEACSAERLTPCILLARQVPDNSRCIGGARYEPCTVCRKEQGADTSLVAADQVSAELTARQVHHVNVSVL